MAMGSAELTSPAPSAVGNAGTNLSKSAGLDFFPDQVGESALRLKAGELGHDAGLGSRGNANSTSNDVAIDEGVEGEDFFSWFRAHVSCPGSVAENPKIIKSASV